jgi:hypothetical protein
MIVAVPHCGHKGGINRPAGGSSSKLERPLSIQ